MRNLDARTVAGFGEEWSAFSQEPLSPQALREQFDRYFAIFDWNGIDQAAVGFDVGCGSGRWARFVAPRVGLLHCIDASDKALAVARRNLARYDNCRFHHVSLDEIPVEDESMDFGYALGVLHHLPDPFAGILSCVRKLKPGAPFLAYIYYAFDNRPAWFRRIWSCSDSIRRVVATFPFRLKWLVTQIVACTVYYPLARSARAMERLGLNVDNFPLSAYRDRPFYSMRTDALDRFGTRVEHRFSRDEITAMFAEAGLERIVFHDDVPFWCVIGYRAEHRGLTRSKDRARSDRRGVPHQGQTPG